MNKMKNYLPGQAIGIFRVPDTASVFDQLVWGETTGIQTVDINRFNEVYGRYLKHIDSINLTRSECLRAFVERYSAKPYAYASRKGIQVSAKEVYQTALFIYNAFANIRELSAKKFELLSLDAMMTQCLSSISKADCEKNLFDIIDRMYAYEEAAAVKTVEKPKAANISVKVCIPRGLLQEFNNHGFAFS